jgi:hypothetical protein
MDNSGMFSNSLPETSIGDAYKYQTYSDYLNSVQFKKSGFSPVCIFCSFGDSIALVDDGSFRSCKKCRRQFKAKFS